MKFPVHESNIIKMSEGPGWGFIIYLGILGNLGKASWRSMCYTIIIYNSSSHSYNVLAYYQVSNFISTFINSFFLFILFITFFSFFSLSFGCLFVFVVFLT